MNLSKLKNPLVFATIACILAFVFSCNPLDVLVNNAAAIPAMLLLTGPPRPFKTDRILQQF